MTLSPPTDMPESNVLPTGPVFALVEPDRGPIDQVSRRADGRDREGGAGPGRGRAPVRRAADGHRQRHVLTVDGQRPPHRDRHRPAGLVGVHDQIVRLIPAAHAELVEISGGRPAETGAEPVVREQRPVLRLEEAGPAVPAAAVGEDLRRARRNGAAAPVGAEGAAGKVIARAIAGGRRWIGATAPAAALAAAAPGRRTETTSRARRRRRGLFDARATQNQTCGDQQRQGARGASSG